MMASTMAVLSGGSSEAQHKEHPGHEEAHPVQPNLPAVPDLPEQKIEKPAVDGLLKKDADLVKDRAVRSENKVGAENVGAENIGAVLTTKAATVEHKTDKKDTVQEKGDVRKLQQVNNESKNESPLKETGSLDKNLNNREAKLAKGTLTAHGSNQELEEAAKKSIIRVKKDDGSEVEGEERINPDQGNQIKDSPAEANQQKLDSDHKSGSTDRKPDSNQEQVSDHKLDSDHKPNSNHKPDSDHKPDHNQGLTDSKDKLIEDSTGAHGKFTFKGFNDSLTKIEIKKTEIKQESENKQTETTRSDNNNNVVELRREI